MDKLLRNKKIVILAVTLILMSLAISYSAPLDVVSTIFNKLIYISHVIIFLFLLNILVVTLRFGLMLRVFDVRLPWLSVIRANVSGYVASMFVFSIFGQVLGRDLVLKKHGVPSSVIAAITLYERLFMFFIGSFLCLLGSFYIFGAKDVLLFFEKLPIIEILVVFVLLGFALVKIGLSRYEKVILSRIKTRSLVWFLIVCGGVTIVGQVLMIVIFVIAIKYLFPEISSFLLLSAAAIISFVAAIPISVNGWGVREVGSIAVLSTLGVGATDAVAVSVYVGVCSIIGIYLAFFISNILNTRLSSSIVSQTYNSVGDIPWMAAVCLLLIIALTAFLIFFQVHVPIGSYGEINVNLADPFVLFGGVLLLFLCIKQRKLPVWSYDKFNLILIGLTVFIILGFFNGVINIGVTGWALNNRLFGWLVILSYLATGYLCVAVFGRSGFRRFAEILILTAVFVIVTVYISRLLAEIGYIDQGPYNFEGFSSNRNAFSFQMLIVLAAVFAIYRVYSRLEVKKVVFSVANFWILAGAIIIFGIILSGSRTAYITLFFLVMFAFIFSKLNEKKALVFSICISFAMLYSTEISLPNMKSTSSLEYRGGEIAKKSEVVLSSLTDDLSKSYPRFSELVLVKKLTTEVENILSNSDAERWVSIIKGLEMWLDYPVIGGGLGHFIEHSKHWWEEGLVIHSTPVWVMAEFGLAGLLGLIIIFVCLVKYIIKRKNITPVRAILPMILIIFFFFGLVHDIFYQRIYWLMLGAVLATCNFPHGSFLRKSSPE